MRARALAIDELVNVGLLEDHIGVDKLDRELAQLTSGSDIDRELAAMKMQLEAPKTPPQLTDGSQGGQK